MSESPVPMRHGARLPARILIGLAALAGVVALAAVLVWHLNLRDEPDLSAEAVSATQGAAPDHAAQVARGAYLAQAGNCMACHTARGGAAFAGGRRIDTPYGGVMSSNLTPDADTGIGRWTPAHFWRAMHNGRSRDGRLLYPAFPYTSFTQITRADSDALHAYLHSLPAVRQANAPHDLRWPYDSQAALAVWRALYFKPERFEADTARSAAWNRGAYLVRGLGHCAACHSSRNALGASIDPLGLAGGPIPMQNWYAPSLTSPSEAGLAHWDARDIVALLRDGVSRHASVSGPMAEVVARSTQHLSSQDLDAMAEYLLALPQTVAPNVATSAAPAAARPASPQALRGAKLYEQQCVHCHGDQGQGIASAYPALAGNRAVTLSNPANLVQIVLYGGFAPATAGNPRPYGMPPFVTVLSDDDIAAVLTHIRGAWGNGAGAVSEFDVNRHRQAR
ncbi:MAG: cytochrome c [Burkholderiaceae bacterium]|nr:cytochrome c [Burkholderiaceae bacterium]MDO9089789.1 cytochrome c [Burkholderiaceae bacterium]